MDNIEEYVDERQKAWCIHCGEWIAELESNLDHVPSKCLLTKPLPENLPTVSVCKQCNTSFSLDEEYTAAFLRAVLVGSTEPELQITPEASRTLQRNRKLRARIAEARIEHKTDGGEVRIMWTPEQDWIKRIIVKNARGHGYFEYGLPMLDEPERVWVAPLATLSGEQRAEFENIDMGPAWPEVGSRMLTRVVTGQDLSGCWVVVQEGVYRYAVVQTDGLLVRSILYEYLATEVCWGDSPQGTEGSF